MWEQLTRRLYVKDGCRVPVQLPAFKHGDIILNESCATCLYLENQFKSQGIKLIPDSAEDQAVMYQRMMEGLALTDKLNSVIYYDCSVPEEERHDSAVKRNKEALTAELKLWEGYLENVSAGSYLAGAFSLADVIVFPSIACCLWGVILNWPNITAC
ncbi:unnamed protein product [Oreochromis niloticus]|nr:unnamed protein product [Mustela putorius furo]